MRWWSCKRSLVFSYGLLCCGFWLSNRLPLSANSLFADRSNRGPTRFELKFQSELDNSTVIKHELQQQIFKCQVRLAPVNQQAQFKSRFKSIITQLKQDSPLSSITSQTFDTTNTIPNNNSGSISSNYKWQQPSNVSLAIDWFKDDQRLDNNLESSLVVINVELKSNTSSLSSPLANARNYNDKITSNNKSSKPRIEIKNTLNGNQLKLTSRLKLNQVRVNDSGHYKCIARASFQSSSYQVQIDENQNLHQSNRALKLPLERQQQQQQNQLVLIEQTLESNSGSLLVKNTTTLFAGQQEETVLPEGEHKELKLAPSIRDSGRKRKLEFLSNSEASSSDNSFSSGRRSQAQSNDTRHATTQREEVNNNANKGSQTGTGNGDQESPTNRENSNNSNNQFDSLDLTSTDIISDKDSADSELSLSRETKSKQNLNNQFEDDEDLFKLDPDKIEFINNKQTSIDDETADLSSLRRTRIGLQQNSRSLDQENSLFEVDSSGGGGGGGIQIEDQSNREGGGENIKSSSNLSSSTAMINEDKNLMTKNTKINTYNLDKLDNGDLRTRNELNNGGIFTMNDYLGSSFHSTKLQIVKLVHKITPELSCYTGNGEKYRGNVSLSIDRRSCLNWNYVKRNTKGNFSDISIQQAFQTKLTRSNNYNDNHNYCRNPNLDPRGPWCFVQYIDELDNGSWQNLIIVGVKQQQQQQQLTGNLELSANFAQGKFIQRHCPISACSEYLWIYIVAPPLGFLIFLSCLVALFIKYIRKSYHKNNSILFRATKRKGLPTKFNKLIHSQANRFVPKKFVSSSSKRKKGYLDDDIFEIVEDIDWSDAQTHSLSPKSTESLKLNSSFSSSSNVTDSSNNKHSNACKSISPLFNEKALDSSIVNRKLSSHDLATNTSNRSVTQVGPMFATLRCQMRNQAVKKSNKSSTFIEQCNLASTTTTNNSSSSVSNKLPPYVDRTNWLANSLNQQQQALSPSCSSSSSSNNNAPTINSSRPDGYDKRTINEASYLISCSTTSEDIEKSSNSQMVESTSNSNLNEKFVKGSDLPQLNASSIVICLDQQPVYEGKFSQVKMAFMKQHIESSLTPSSSSSSSSLLSSFNNASSIGHLGTQVAICGLKSAAVIDPDTFKPSNLKLRNLNHLNILKLIGYAQIQDEIGGSNGNNNTQFNIQFQQSLPCSLIYDMTQLVDLNDWLKQQNKDTLTSDEPGNDLGVRRNLTCFAKQIALAIDYLHDRNIIYKDLACRNCFLDPTKMLVKLASFNIEFVNFNSIDEKTQNLKSMIRPKYLLDYYVIDSRPSDCQLLPLSWIPLESILFNKFNKQTDIWSFGCLLYELFSLGEVAYFGYSSKQVIDSVRSNLMPPQPLLCPNGIYKLMCKCLSDIPTIRPNIKQIYEQLNLYSGQCSSFLDHHLCSLATNMFDDSNNSNNNSTFSSSNLNNKQLVDLKVQSKLGSVVGGSTTNRIITTTKSYANIKNFSQATNIDQDLVSNYDNHLIHTSLTSDETVGKPEVTKIPLSRSINLGGNRTENNFSNFKNVAKQQYEESNHYDEPIVNVKDLSEK